MKYINSALFFFLLFVMISFGGNLYAGDFPSLKVDLNRFGRPLIEVNNPNFKPWTFPESKQIVYKDNNLVITLRGLTLNNSESSIDIDWNKGGISVSNDSRLTCDGVVAEVIEMTIHGLPAGNNTLLTYHNMTDAAYSETNSLGLVANPMKILVDGKVVVGSFVPTDRKLQMSDVAVSYITIPVQAGKDVVVRFEPILIHPQKGTPFNKVILNGFELNTPNFMLQAKNPYPKDGNLHADGDCGKVVLTWNPSSTAISHHLYFGKDSASVANATIASPVFIGNKAKTDTTYTVSTYNLDDYFWRVDEIAADGSVTPGDLWRFKTRHQAFPEAEGYGRFAHGGRGGDVVHVTNLNDDGEGSFRQAVTTNGGKPRTVVFDVSGLIDLKSRLVMGSNITVAGQTAPGKGICFRESPLGVSSDCICQFVRLRLGHGKTYDGMGMAGVNNGIIDHCSISWTIDEAFSSRNAQNITLQHTLISEALNVAGHKNYEKGKEHGYAGSIGGNVGSFHHDLLAHCEGRNWSMAGGLDSQGFYGGRLDIFNMVVYNWGHRATDGGAHEVNFVNNYYKEGPSTTIHYLLNAQLEGAGKGSQSYYFHGNIKAATDGRILCDSTDNESSRTYHLTHGQILDWKLFVDKPFFPSYAKIQSAEDAYKSVLSDVGCNLPLLDDHDKRIINETLTGTTTYKGSVSGAKGLIDNETDAGGYENYPEEKRAADFDTDGDGLPDWWEKIIGTNPNGTKGDFFDSNADADHDGYTNLEDYLHWMSHPHYDVQVSKNLKIDLGQYIKGYTASPKITITNVDNCQVKLKNGTTAVVSVKNVGLADFKFTVTDAKGSSMTQMINLQVTQK